jgi:hypothetical protein
MLPFRARYERAAASSLPEGEKNLISDLLLRNFLRAFTSLRMPAKNMIFDKNQKVGNQGMAQGFGALLQKKSLKDVTDEQLVHR